MTVERGLRLIAGTFVLLSLGLSQVHSPYWMFFTAFVGLNLFQSGFTDTCPMKLLLVHLGLPGACAAGKAGDLTAKTARAPRAGA